MPFNTIADKSLAEFEMRLNATLRYMEGAIMKELERFPRKAGRIMVGADSFGQITQMYQNLLLELERSGYPEAVSALQGWDKELIEEIAKDSKVPFQFTQTSRDTINALRQIQLNKFDEIGATAMDAVRDSVTQTILAGRDIGETIDSIREQLDTKFKNYAWTYANTTRRDIIQQVQLESAKEYDGELYWQFFGPDDDVTRPACSELLERNGGYYTDAERQEAEAEFADERAFNCRHVFIQVSKDEYDANVK